MKAAQCSRVDERFQVELRVIHRRPTLSFGIDGVIRCQISCHLVTGQCKRGCRMGSEIAVGYAERAAIEQLLGDFAWYADRGEGLSCGPSRRRPHLPLLSKAWV